MPGDDKVVAVAHPPHGFDDFALIVLDDFDSLELLARVSGGGRRVWISGNSHNTQGEAPLGHVCRVGLVEASTDVVWPLVSG